MHQIRFLAKFEGIYELFVISHFVGTCQKNTAEESSNFI